MGIYGKWQLASHCHSRSDIDGAGYLWLQLENWIYLDEGQGKKNTYNNIGTVV